MISQVHSPKHLSMFTLTSLISWCKIMCPDHAQMYVVKWGPQPKMANWWWTYKEHSENYDREKITYWNRWHDAHASFKLLPILESTFFQIILVFQLDVHSHLLWMGLNISQNKQLPYFAFCCGFLVCLLTGWNWSMMLWGITLGMCLFSHKLSHKLTLM